MTNTATAEILPMEQKLVAFNPLRGKLAELKEQNKSLVFDYESKEGDKAARSYVYKLRQTKTAVNEVHKAEKEESLRHGKKVDGERNEIIAEIEGMIKVHQDAIDAVEAKEKAHIDNAKNAIEHIRNCGMGSVGGQKQPLDMCLFELRENVVIDDTFGEFEADANREKKVAIAKLEAWIVEEEKRAAEQTELEQLRKDAADRAQRDRDAAIAKEAADKARLEAEQKAQRETEVATAKAKAEAEAITAKAKSDAEAAERERAAIQQQAAESEARAAKAEADRISAEEKAKKDAIAAAEKAEEDKQAAIEQERERIAALARAEATEREAREADLAHKATINSQAMHVLKNLIGDDLAEKVIDAIAAGKIPNVTINY